MNTTIYLRKTKNEQKDSSLQTICLRYRKGRSDLRAVTPLTIQVEYWNPKIPGYAASTPNNVMTAKERKDFNQQLLMLMEFVSDQCDNAIEDINLKQYIEQFFHSEQMPKVERTIEAVLNAEPTKTIKAPTSERGLTMDEAISNYLDRDVSQKHIRSTKGIARKLKRFVAWQREMNDQPDYELYIEEITPVELAEIREYCNYEHLYYKQFPDFYKDFDMRTWHLVEPSPNSLTAIMARITFVLNWCVKMGLMKNVRYKSYDHGVLVYGSPFYLTIEERDTIFNADISGWPEHMQTHRDQFIFQCMVGCRLGDLQALTKANIVDGVLQYIPNKTKQKGVGETIRVPLNEKAKAIIDRQNTGNDRLFKKHCRQGYNSDIQIIFQLLGINRMVTILNRHTRKEEQHPLYELATSHIARRTFIGNLYKKVKDPALIGSMSGHCANSKAFKRYRNIDDDMKQELVDMIE